MIHDETIDRTTDGTGYVKDYTLEALKQFNASVKFPHLSGDDHHIWCLERIPTLAEVLDLITPYQIELNIELKTSIFPYEGIEEKVVSLVDQFDYADKVIYSSFHLPSILTLKKIEPSARIAWLVTVELSRPAEYVESLGLEGLHLHKDLLLTSEKEEKGVDECSIRVWTVNDEKEMVQCLNMHNIEAMMTDFPKQAIALRNVRWH